jgi:hypothetical protein
MFEKVHLDLYPLWLCFLQKCEVCGLANMYVIACRMCSLCLQIVSIFCHKRKFMCDDGLDSTLQEIIFFQNVQLDSNTHIDQRGYSLWIKA